MELKKVSSDSTKNVMNSSIQILPLYQTEKLLHMEDLFYLLFNPSKKTNCIACDLNTLYLAMVNYHIEASHRTTFNSSMLSCIREFQTLEYLNRKK